MRTFLTVNGEIVFRDKDFVVITDAECLKQRLNNRIKLFLGEWFLAPSEGIPWIDILSEKNNVMQIEAELRRAIIADSEVKTINSLTMTEGAVPRSLLASFSVNSIYGETVTGETQI